MECGNKLPDSIILKDVLALFYTTVCRVAAEATQRIMRRDSFRQVCPPSGTQANGAGPASHGRGINLIADTIWPSRCIQRLVRETPAKLTAQSADQLVLGVGGMTKTFYDINNNLFVYYISLCFVKSAHKIREKHIMTVQSDHVSESSGRRTRANAHYACILAFTTCPPFCAKTSKAVQGIKKWFRPTKQPEETTGTEVKAKHASGRRCEDFWLMLKRFMHFKWAHISLAAATVFYVFLSLNRRRWNSLGNGVKSNVRRLPRTIDCLWFRCESGKQICV